MKVYAIFTCYGIGGSNDSETCFELIDISTTLEGALAYIKKKEIRLYYFDFIHPTMNAANKFTYIGERGDCKDNCRANHFGGVVIEEIETIDSEVIIDTDSKQVATNILDEFCECGRYPRPSTIRWVVDKHIKEKYNTYDCDQLIISKRAGYHPDELLLLDQPFILCNTSVLLTKQELYEIIKYYLDRDNTYPWFDERLMTEELYSGETDVDDD